MSSGLQPCRTNKPAGHLWDEFWREDWHTATKPFCKTSLVQRSCTTQLSLAHNGCMSPFFSRVAALQWQGRSKTVLLAFRFYTLVSAQKKTKTYPTLDWNIFFVLLELEEDAPLGRSNSAATCYSRPLISSWEKTTCLFQGNGWLDIFWGSQVAGSKTSALSVTSSRILDIWSLRVTSYRCLRGVKYQCKQNIQKTEQHLSKNLESSDLVVSTLLFRSLTTGMSQLMKFPGTNHAEVQKFIWCVFLDPKTWDLAEDPTKSPTCHVIKMHETGKIEKYPAREEWQTTKLDKEKHLSAKRGRIRDDSR